MLANLLKSSELIKPVIIERALSSVASVVKSRRHRAWASVQSSLNRDGHTSCNTKFFKVVAGVADRDRRRTTHRGTK